jgi:hypothetical protein
MKILPPASSDKPDLSLGSNSITTFVYGIGSLFAEAGERLRRASISYSPPKVETMTITTAFGEKIETLLQNINQCLEESIQTVPPIVSKGDQKNHAIACEAKQASLAAMKAELDLSLLIYQQEKNIKEMLDARQQLGDKLRKELLPKLGMSDDPTTVLTIQTIPMRYPNQSYRIAAFVAISSEKGSWEGVVRFDGLLIPDITETQGKRFFCAEELYYFNLEAMKADEYQTALFAKLDVEVTNLHFISMKDIEKAEPHTLEAFFPTHMIPFLKKQATSWNNPIYTEVNKLKALSARTGYIFKQVFNSSAALSEQVLIEVNSGHRVWLEPWYIESHLIQLLGNVPMIESKFVAEEAAEYDAKQAELAAMKHECEVKASAYDKEKMLHHYEEMGAIIRKQLLNQLHIADEPNTTVEIKMIPRFPGHSLIMDVLASIVSAQSVWKGVIRISNFGNLDEVKVLYALSMEEVRHASQQKLAALFPAAMIPFLQKQAEEDEESLIASFHMVDEIID